MARISIVLAALLALTASVADAKVGNRAPAFRLPTVVGGPTTGQWKLEDHLEKKPIVVLFWATWCGPCKQELPFYQELFERHAADGLQVVAISMDDTSTITQAGPAARRLGVKYPVLSDLDTRVAGQLNPRKSAPFSVWIGRDGTIAWEREGFALAERDEIAKGIAKLVSAESPEKKADPAPTPKAVDPAPTQAR